MADFDTATKRFFGLGIDLPWPVSLPVPSGAVDATARPHWLRKYLGISWTAAVGPAYGLSDLTTMVTFYFRDTLHAQAGDLSDDYRGYLDGVRGTTGEDDLNTAQWVDLKT